MPDTATARSADPPPGAAEGPAGTFAELRTLLVGPEQRQLSSIQTRLDDPVRQAREVSRVLPAAVELRTHDPHLKRALAPTIEEAISASVRRNPRPLADALFPIIGPAIRKAIAATLSGMLESLNTTLEHSLSWRSLRWRLDARRTGKPFAEIVLLNTLLYRVEQVFLIHRPSGLLLQHLIAPGMPAQDPDLVSGMLTAIRDFVQDSFGVAETEGLQTLKVGELSVWIEQGPHALVAVVIRGTAPPAIREALQQTVERVHAWDSDLLANFDGDTSKFENVRPLLEDCLRQQYRTREGAVRRPLLKIAAAIVLLALGLWMFFAMRSRARWNGYVEALRREPGVVVVSTGRDGGKYVVNGLRDPLARDPASLLPAHDLRRDAVTARWDLYQALDPPLVLARARHVLAPSAGVQLDYHDGVLSAAGPATTEWIETASRVAPVLPGVVRFDPSAAIEGTLRTLASSIEAAVPLFVKGTTSLTSEGEKVISEQIGRLQSLAALARLSSRQVSLELVGEADADGPPDTNLPLSARRARHVLALLQQQHLDGLQMIAVGIGSREAGESSAGETEKQRHRRVSFRVNGVLDRH